MHFLCERNWQIYRSPSYHSGHHGGLPRPTNWAEHPGCEFCRDALRYITEKHALHPDNKKNPGKAEEGTQYAFTLTMPPDYQPAKPLQEVAMKIMEHGLTSKPYQKALQYAYVLEHTEAGTPHIHGVYKTQSGRRISSKYFKRYWPLWDEKVKLGHGHKGGYHQKARHAESYNAYLEKEGVVVKGGACLEDIDSAANDPADEENIWEPGPVSPLPPDYDGSEDDNFISHT